jgi:simple sugar transport system permease protein
MAESTLRGPAVLTPAANLWKRVTPSLVPILAVLTALIMTLPVLFISSTVRKVMSGDTVEVRRELGTALNTAGTTYSALIEGSLGVAINDLASPDDFSLMQSFVQSQNLNSGALRRLATDLSTLSQADPDAVRRYGDLLKRFPDLTDDQFDDYGSRIPIILGIGEARYQAMRPLIDDLGKLERSQTQDLANKYGVLAALSANDRAALEADLPSAKQYSDADLLKAMAILKEQGIVKLQRTLERWDELKAMGIEPSSPAAQDLAAMSRLTTAAVRQLVATSDRLDAAGISNVDDLLYQVRVTSDLYDKGLIADSNVVNALTQQLPEAATKNLIVRRPSSVDRLLVVPGSNTFGITYTANNLPEDVYFRLGGSAWLFFPANLEAMLVRSIPFVIAGLAVALGFKAGLFNIGAEGQLYAGGTLAVTVGFAAPFAGLPPLIHVPLALIAGILGGMLWGAIPGTLKAFTGAHEVINTIMLNFVAILLVDWLIKSTAPIILLDPSASTPRTPIIADSAKLPRFNEISPMLIILAGIAIAAWGLWQRRERLREDFRWAIRPVIDGILVIVGGFFLAWITVRGALHVGLVIMILAVWFADWFLNRTTLGFELRTVGANPAAARYAGMNVRWNIIFAMLLSGALAGLAGTIEIIGKQFNMQPAFFSGLGFDAIAVALLARSNPRNMILAGFLWGSLLAGAGLMQVRANISIDLVKIVQALIIMFIAADAIIRYLWRVPAAKAGEKAAATFSKGWGG